MGIEQRLLDLDPLSRVFVATFLLVGVPCLLYMRSLHKDARLLAVATLFIGAALGVVVAADLLWFLIFWEVMVLVACYLMVHCDLACDARQATASRQFRHDATVVSSGVFPVAYRYFLVQMVAGTSLFLAVAIQYAVRGSFEMDVIVAEAVPLFLIAFLIKAAVVPFHFWVPITYPCVPPAVAVVLSAYATKIGVYAFARLLPGIPWVAYAGAGVAVFGVVMAMRQRTARRLLSYHLISQVGYMITGIGVGTELGVGAGALHMMNHVAYKSLLFMAAGMVLHRRGSEVMQRVGGLGKAMPLTFLTALVGAAAISGVPPLNGYVSKTLLKAATEGDAFLQWALFLAGIGTAFSFSKFIWYLFLHRPAPELPSPQPAGKMPFGAGLAMALLALLCVGQGVFYRPFVDMAFGTETIPYAVYEWHQLIAGPVPVVLGMVLYGLNYRAAGWLRGSLPSDHGAFRARGRSRPRAGAAHPARAEPADSLRPADVEVLYAWLLHQALRLSRSIAMRARDETQLYLLVITALLVGLVAFLAW